MDYLLVERFFHLSSSLLPSSYKCFAHASFVLSTRNIRMTKSSLFASSLQCSFAKSLAMLEKASQVTWTLVNEKKFGQKNIHWKE